MAGETQLTVIGNLTADVDLKFTNSGVALANFTIASTPKVFDKQSNQWKDGDPLFLRCTVWREYAENVAATLSKGTRVIAKGNLTQRSYETREGEKRTSYELAVDEVGPSLRFATAQVTRATERGQGGFSGGGGAGMGASTGQGGNGPQGGAQDSGGWAATGADFSGESAPF